MSSGTIVYPKIEDYKNLNRYSDEELQSTSDTEVRIRTNRFVELRALAFATPHKLFGEKAYDKIRDLVDSYFNEFVESYKLWFDIGIILELRSQLKGYKNPYIYLKHIGYRNIWEVKEELKSNKQYLIKLKSKIYGLCLATPIDITPRDQEQYVDGHEEPIYYLERELDDLEDSLEECLTTINTLELLIKYWDGHEQD